MGPLSISRLIFDTIPQLYQASAGKYPFDIQINRENVRAYSLIPLSPALVEYVRKSNAIWEELRPMTEGDISQILEREWIQQKFVVDWLQTHTQVKEWGLILDYARRLSRRLTESQLKAKTIVVEPSLSGATGIKLSDESYWKVFDQLGSTTHTFFRIDQNLNILGYHALSRTEDKSDSQFRFYPSFLHPVIKQLKSEDSVVVHISENGGIMIANSKGLVASKRVLDSWTVYDIEHVVGSVSEILKPQLEQNNCRSKPHGVVRSLFQILFDIMTKMNGGLVILDEPDRVDQYLMHGIAKGDNSTLNMIFEHEPCNELLFSNAESRKLVELSSVDGAIVLDLHGNLIQVGSMVMAHPTAPNRFGTREAAGYSVAKNGGTAFKISEDGHMSLFFTTPELTESEVHRFDFR